MKHISRNVKRDFKPFPILFGSFKYMDNEEILSMWSAVQNPFFFTLIFRLTWILFLMCASTALFLSLARHGHSITKQKKRVHQKDISMVSEYFSVILFFCFKMLTKYADNVIVVILHVPKHFSLTERNSITIRDKMIFRYAQNRKKGFATVRKTRKKQHCRRWKWYSVLYLYSVSLRLKNLSLREL